MTTQTKTIDKARGQIGYKESPAGSNHTKYGEWYGMDYCPWCATFCTWNAVGCGSSALARGTRYSYVPYIEADAKAGKNGLKKIAKDGGKPGDLITFDWDSDGLADHVGLVEKNLGGGSYQTIEGNTSTSDNSNGGQVMRRTRYAGDVSMIVRYPDESGEEDDDLTIHPGDSGNGVKHVQRGLNGWSQANGKGWKVSEDGTWEKDSAMTDRVKEFQKAFGLEQTGSVDGVTNSFLQRFNPA